MFEQSDKRSAILKASTELFERYGYAKTSLEDISKAAHIGKGTIYYYFKSKEDIFVQIVQEFMEEFLRIMKTKIAEESSFEGKFTVYFRTPITLLKANMSTLSEALRSISVVNQSKIDEFRIINKKRIAALLSEIFEFGIKEGIISEFVPVDRFVDVFNQWFLLTDTNLEVFSREEFVNKIERDHELWIQIILYGITKRG
ncbi:MAG: hypothetical protein CVU48_10640 [Candidatus Cloacimonetes bacterium HGW-Cloacimonetes-1]|jgi:AcrR family transcriptional regulator|nr:MAG: hypothetical protein CVU48_10640 [Candidatus Cloacimonetes bacterium HGW-Cloacimonetes-1]